MEARDGQVACGLKPKAPASSVPPSGWVALVATLGTSQVCELAVCSFSPSRLHVSHTDTHTRIVCAHANNPCIARSILTNRSATLAS